MINTIQYFDEITLWWEKPQSGAYSYRATVSGGNTIETDKTHCTFSGLKASTEYTFEVETLFGGKSCSKESVVAKTAAAKQKVDVTKFGANGDGKTMNTSALQKAADSLKKSEYLYFPKGVYLTGSISLHGDSEIYLDEGAVIQGSENFTDYLPKMTTRFEGLETQTYSPLIRIGTMDSKAAQTSRSVIIRGKGAILGGGKALCDAVIESEKERLKDFLAANAEYVKTCENEKTIPGRARPFLIDIANVKGIAISGITIGYGAAWNLHVLYCKDVSVFDCKFVSDGVWNGDGIDPDSTENMAIFGCLFNTHDDAIAIKSGKNPEGNKINRPTRHVRIFDCSGYPRGIAIGSELSGGIEDVAVWDCNMKSFRIKTTKKRGGYVKNVRVFDSVFRAFVSLTTKYKCNDDGVGVDELTELRDFSFENVEIFGIGDDRKTEFAVPPLQLIGFDDPSCYMRNVTLKNIVIHPNIDGEVQHFDIENVENISIENLRSSPAVAELKLIKRTPDRN